MSRRQPLDYELEAIFDLQMPDCDAEASDAVDEFVEQGTLANALGGDRTAHARVERLAEEVAIINKQADSILRHTTAAPAPVPADDLLEKRYRGIHAGKKASRIEKTANGWVMEYDERGELLRGYLADEE
jgi:hypothetical protein